MTTPRNIRILIITACAAIAVRLLNVLWLHPLNWDEIEFFRATDFVRRGFVPFRDFFEHHTPLQWFLFAPVAALTRSVDGWAIVTMRVAQIPLWIAAFTLMSIWMRDAGIGRFARWAAIAIAVSSSFLMIAAVEYRVDVPGCALYAAALVMLQRMPARPRLAFAAGAFLAFAGLANLRLGPVSSRTLSTAARPNRCGFRRRWRTIRRSQRANAFPSETSTALRNSASVSKRRPAIVSIPPRSILAASRFSTSARSDSFSRCVARNVAISVSSSLYCRSRTSRSSRR